jgi:hypothetical protein
MNKNGALLQFEGVENKKGVVEGLCGGKGV